jgi:hypothetical protein
MEETGRIEIWFFIGALLLAYGILIMGAGIVHFFSPPAQTLALAELHADVWWGALLLVIGLVYTVKYWPWGAKKG